MSNDLLHLRMLACYAQARAATIKSRTAAKRFQRGASALEWAVISAIVVAIAMGIYVVVHRVVEANKGKIGNGQNAGGQDG